MGSRPMNIWYRDSARSIKEQNKITMKLKNSVTAIIDYIHSLQEPKPENMNKIINWWKTYCSKEDSSINIEDLMKITKDNGNGWSNIVNNNELWPCGNKLYNVITEFLNITLPGNTQARQNEFVIKQMKIIETSRIQIAKMLHEYENDIFDEIENISYDRIDKTDEHEDYNVIKDSAVISNLAGQVLWTLDKDASGDSCKALVDYKNKAIPWDQLKEDNVYKNNNHCFIPLSHPNENKFKRVDVRIVQSGTGTSHPPGLEHRIDEVESLLDNSLSSLPSLENRLEGIEGVVKDYDIIKNYLAEEINSLKNTKIEENLENEEQMEQLRRFVRNELNELKNEQNNVNKYEPISNDLLSMNDRLVKLENKETTTLDNNQESNVLLNEMITIKNDVSKIKEQVNTSLSQANEVKTEVTTIRDEIVSTNQKIKKVLKK